MGEEVGARMSRWTIYVCPLCGTLDPSQHTRDPDRPHYCFFAARGLSRDGVVLHPYSSSPDWNPEVEYEPIVVVRGTTSVRNREETK